MRLIPDSANGWLREGNDCHKPAGSSEGGEFCSKGGLTLKQRKAQRAKGISQMKVAAGGVVGEKEQKRLRTLAKGRETQRITRMRDETPGYGTGVRPLPGERRKVWNAMPMGTRFKVEGKDTVFEKVQPASYAEVVDGRPDLSFKYAAPPSKGFKTITVVRDETPTYGGKEPKVGGLVKFPVGRDTRGITGFYEDLDKAAQRHPLLDREVILGGNVIADLQNRDDHVYLTGLQSLEQGSGAGTKAMQSIVELADRHGVTLRLTASPLRITRGPVSKTSKPKLIAFYKRFGFTPDPIYTRSSGAMVRKPR